MENNIGRYAQFPTIDGIIIAQAIKSLDVLGKVVILLLKLDIVVVV